MIIHNYGSKWSLIGIDSGGGQAKVMRLSDIEQWQSNAITITYSPLT